MKKSKPILIKIISILIALFSIYSLIMTLIFSLEIINTKNITETIYSKAQNETQELQQVMEATGISFNNQNVKVLILIVLLSQLLIYTGILFLVYNFYNAKNWARITLLIFSYFIAVIIMLRTIVSGFTSPLILAKLIISLLIAIYLSFNKEIRAFFLKKGKKLFLAK